MCSADVNQLEQAALELWRLPINPRSPLRCAEELVTLRKTIDLLELKFAKSAAEFDSTDEFAQLGSVSGVDWIRHECGMTRFAAARSVCVGGQLKSLPQSVDSVIAGKISFAHLALLASTAKTVKQITRDNKFDETPLLQAAKRHSVSRFSFDCDHARHQADAKHFLDEHINLVELNRLELTPAEQGNISLHGLFDPVSGATIRAALEPLAKRNGVGDQRRRERRLADALVEISHHHLDGDTSTTTRASRPHLQVTTSIETLMGKPSSPAAEMEFSPPIPAVTAQRLACDSSVTRIVFGPDSAIVDVGRSRRVASAAARRALVSRDKGCAWPGCDRPPSWTAAHHLQHWAQGGTTDLTNLALLCHRHHQLVHEGGWQLVHGEPGLMVAVPPPPPSWPRTPIRGPDVRAA